MLYGLGPGELLGCLIPFFLILIVVFALLVRNDLKERESEDKDHDE
jgi:hypothetical protein